MRNIATKVDGTTTLSASDWNSNQTELENIITSTGQSLDPAGGPDVDLDMLGKSACAYASASWAYDDSGAADAYVLARSTTLKTSNAYFDNMMVCFTPGSTNTGASTINVTSLGVKNIKILGSDPAAGDILAGKEIIMKYDGTNFEIVTGEGQITTRLAKLTTDPVGSPATDTLYKGNIIKAWTNFNGTGAVAKNDDFNVSGYTDTGPGDYIVTWDTDFANNLYVAVGSSSQEMIVGLGTFAVGSLQVLVDDDAGTPSDATPICIIAIGDQT